MAYFEVNKKPPLSFPSVSGSIVTFNAQYALPLKSHTVDIDSVSGVSAINIYATAKNLFAYYFNNFKTASNSITIAPNNTNSVNVSGTYAGGGGARAWSYDGKTQANYGNYIQFLEDTSVPIEEGTYTMSSVSENPSNFINYVLIGDADNYGQSFANSQPSLQKFYLNPNNSHTFTVPSGKRMAIMTEVRGMTTDVSIDATLTIQLEKNDSNTNIETVTPHTISIGQTVNEATYNARTGVMEVTQPSVQTIQLPPCPIDTLNGVNNIWADTGDTTLQYPKFG